MKIAITETNRSKIEAALAAVNGNAVAFCITRYDRIASLADSYEKKLAALPVLVKHRSGTTVAYTPPGPTASSYRYRVITTHVVLQRGSRDWFLIDAQRKLTYPNSGMSLHYTITQNARHDIVDHALRGMTVQHLIEPEYKEPELPMPDAAACHAAFAADELDMIDDQLDQLVSPFEELLNQN